MSKILVGDVGGTNVRLAFARREKDDKVSFEKVQCYSGDDFPTLHDAIHTYIRDENRGLTPQAMGLAVACPVADDFIRLTNRNWSFSKQALQQQVNCERLVIVNDFDAICHALPHMLQSNDLAWLNTDSPPATFRGTVAIFGPGTGLGVSSVNYDHVPPCLISGEGGHTSFAPADHEEFHLLDALSKRFGRVSNERILSGPGLENLYSVLAPQEHKEDLSAAEIAARALDGSDLLCRRALTRFCKVLGAFGGDLALTTGAGAVLVAGGMVPRFLDFFRASPFLDSFADKGRFSARLAQTPVGVITHKFPGLLGISIRTMEVIDD